MKKVVLLVAFLFSILKGFGQYEDMNIVLGSQEDVDNFQQNFPDCTTIGGISIAGAEITNLNGLSMINHVLNSLEVAPLSHWNPETLEFEYLLQDLSGLNGVVTVGGQLSVMNLKNVAINTFFTSLVSVGGQLIVGGQLPQTLNAFPALQTVGQSLLITSSDTLVNLQGFNSLTNINGWFYIQDNSALLYMGDSFNSLTSVGISLVISNNPLMVELPNFNNLETIGVSLGIANCNSLSSLVGLNSLTSVDSIYITQNESLENLNGLNSLQTINQVLNICCNPQLVSLNELSNLESVQDLWINDNLNLTSLSGLENINPSVSVLESISIYGNQNLSNCSITSVCQRLILSETGVNFNVNAENCDSNDQVLNFCNSLGNESFLEQPEFTIYPNPASNFLMINSKISIDNYDIYDLSGSLIYTDKFIERIDVSELSAGIYFLVLRNETVKEMIRFVKE